MRICITGICGFTGFALARALQEFDCQLRIFGMDNLSRSGSHLNRDLLRRASIQVVHGDIRQWSDLDQLPPTDWLIDAAALPSVLAGVDGATSARQLIEHNLFGTVNVLEYARKSRAGVVLLSTSRVYSITSLKSLPLEEVDGAFRLSRQQQLPAHVSEAGVTEHFPTTPPISLYGATKLSSEVLAREYGESFGCPVWINRLGVLAGAGQFGRPDQGIFSFWINSHLRKRPLKYIGFGGSGSQVRDCLHPRDVASLVLTQMRTTGKATNLMNASGGAENSLSLKQLSAWCDERFGAHQVLAEPEERQFDVPWLLLDSSLAKDQFNWQPSVKLPDILEEIAAHAENNPNWLEISNA